nr:hypothetical protein CFP56_67502 [Quercus suber]
MSGLPVIFRGIITEVVMISPKPWLGLEVLRTTIGRLSHRGLIPLENASLIVIRTMFHPMSGLPVIFRGIITEVVMISPKAEDAEYFEGLFYFEEEDDIKASEVSEPDLNIPRRHSCRSGFPPRHT